MNGSNKQKGLIDRLLLLYRMFEKVYRSASQVFVVELGVAKHVGDCATHLNPEPQFTGNKESMMIAIH